MLLELMPNGTYRMIDANENGMAEIWTHDPVENGFVNEEDTMILYPVRVQPEDEYLTRVIEPELIGA